MEIIDNAPQSDNVLKSNTFLKLTAIKPHRIERVAILVKSWGIWQGNYGPRENNSDSKPNNETISKEILEAQPYRLLLTIHDAMIVLESFNEEVKERIIKAVEERINLKPKVKSERVIN